MLSSAMPWDFWLIFLFLGVVVPWRGRLRLERLLAMPAIGTKQKLVLYGSTIIFQWILAGLVVWRSRAGGLTPQELGLARPITAGLLLWGATGAVALGLFQWFNLRRVGRMTGPVPDFMRKLTTRILPQTGLEFAPYCALALTAGVCEEFLYRGFTMAALGRAGVFIWATVLLSSALFGLAHSYQGRSGVLGTALMGLVFGAARVAFASLLPVILWHAAVDVVAGIAGPRYLGTSDVS
jgi:membrane protease YdiL (CAAX protease family)